MGSQEFYSAVRSHPFMAIVPPEMIHEPLAGHTYVCARNGRMRVFAVRPEQIADSSWEEIRAVFLGEREARMMTQVTRIVGYYAMLHNFNGSKRAEHHDRQKGSYVLPERGGAQ